MTLSDYMRARGLSLTQLSTQLGLGVGTVHGWLAGRREPSPALVPRIIERTEGLVRGVDLRRDLALVAAAEAASGNARHACRCAEKVEPA